MNSKLLMVFIRQNEQSSPGVARRVADGFVGVTVEGLLAGAATLQCSASLLPLISVMAKGPLRIRPLVLPGPAATRSPLCQHKHSTHKHCGPSPGPAIAQHCRLAARSLRCATRSPCGLVASAAPGDGRREPLLHRWGLTGHRGAEVTGSPVCHSPTSTAHRPSAALVTSQMRMSLSGKVLLKKPLSHPERSSVAFCLIACTGSSVSQREPHCQVHPEAQWPSSCLTLLPDPQQNMDDDSAALALVSPGPAKGHVFPCECCTAPLTPLGPAWSLGHRGCSEQGISHPPWPWGGQASRDCRHRAMHLCTSQQRLYWTQKAPEAYLG
ncbi:uncharacterized protein LOC116217329 [Meleagris gallopavo]|uniref:uncharacterized protein LOC116217329 n=1 Tax=Meleagris gallopavo TaxID=9103 RepID=UPI0012AC1E25|nr:uncharacterized protein LOC116217329 [Meleagris gallopavo]XP_031412218.1 uncharacterized protein LOC116217329 [Meleagris gallopavo]